MPYFDLKSIAVIVQKWLVTWSKGNVRIAADGWNGYSVINLVHNLAEAHWVTRLGAMALNSKNLDLKCV